MVYYLLLSLETETVIQKNTLKKIKIVIHIKKKSRQE